MLLVAALVPISQLLWSFTLRFHLLGRVLMEPFQRGWDQGAPRPIP